MKHVVIVGAGLGGLRTAEQLRASGYAGKISLIGAEEHPPYDRPPLSKQVLSGVWDAERAVLRDKPALDELGVAYRFGSAATGLEGTTVELADGTTVTGDAVVIATGVAARKLPGQPEEVWSLRTLDDALGLREALWRSRSLLVVGGRIHRGGGGACRARPRLGRHRAGGVPGGSSTGRPPASRPRSSPARWSERSRWPRVCRTSGPTSSG